MMREQIWPERGYGMSGIAWHPRAPLRQRITGWRVRNWRRAILAWSALSLIVLAIAAEPGSDFPKAQAGSVPAVRTILRVADGVIVAVPFLLIALP